MNFQLTEKQTSETGSRSTTRSMKDQKPLEARAVVGELANAIQDGIHNFFADGVVSTSVVVGRVFLAVDDLLGMVEALVGSRADFVTDGGFQVDVDRTRNVLARGGFAEKSVEGIVRGTNRLVVRHGTIGQNAVLEAVKFPALITRLDTGLAQMN